MNKFYKEFKKISRGLENYGYIEWKRTVKDNLEQMDELHLINYKKRIEFAYEKEKHFRQKRDLVDFLSNIVAFMFPFLGVMIGLCSSWGEGLNTITLFLDTNKQEAAELALQTTNSLQGSLLSICCVILLLFLIYYFACFQIERWLTDASINRKIYYSELIEVINDVEKHM